MRSEATEPRAPWIWISPSGLTSLGNITFKFADGKREKNGESENESTERARVQSGNGFWSPNFLEIEKRR